MGLNLVDVSIEVNLLLRSIAFYSQKTRKTSMLHSYINMYFYILIF